MQNLQSEKNWPKKCAEERTWGELAIFFGPQNKRHFHIKFESLISAAGDYGKFGEMMRAPC